MFEGTSSLGSGSSFEGVGSSFGSIGSLISFGTFFVDFFGFGTRSAAYS